MKKFFIILSLLLSQLSFSQVDTIYNDSIHYDTTHFDVAFVVPIHSIQEKDDIYQSLVYEYGKDRQERIITQEESGFIVINEFHVWDLPDGNYLIWKAILYKDDDTFKRGKSITIWTTEKNAAFTMGELY